METTNILHKSISRFLLIIIAIAASFALSSILIILVGYKPYEIYVALWDGAFGTISRFAGVLNFWIPLTVVSMGVIVTFRAGFWNIGVEGQITMGAVFASGIALFISAPAIILIPIAVSAAIVGGSLWAVLAGVLRTRFHVHEIFGGIALNAIANCIANYLISTIWAPFGGNAQDVGLFNETARLPAYSSCFPVSIAGIVFTLTILFLAVFLLSRTKWGLELKAVGKDPNSTRLLNVPVERISLSAFMFGGAMAGLVGAYRVLFTYGTLRMHVSGGIGFLGIMVVLVIGIRVLWVPFVAFVFAALSFSCTNLRLSMALNLSLAKSIQGFLVLFVVLSNGLWMRIAKYSKKNAVFSNQLEATTMLFGEHPHE